MRLLVATFQRDQRNVNRSIVLYQVKKKYDLSLFLYLAVVLGDRIFLISTREETLSLCVWRRVYVVNARTRNLEPWRTDSTEICAVLSKVFNCQSKCAVLGSPPRTSAPEERDMPRDGGVYSISFVLLLFPLSFSFSSCHPPREHFKPGKNSSNVYNNSTRCYQTIRTIINNWKLPS